MSHYLVTGAAGFIGARTSTMLIEQGHTVVGIDNINDAYDPRMKDYRLKKLQALNGFEFSQATIFPTEIRRLNLIHRMKNSMA